MREIEINGKGLDFEAARKKVKAHAQKDNPEAEIISWHNRETGAQSPCCLKCEFDDAPAWEVYGRNHGGRLKITVNGGQFLFIVS